MTPSQNITHADLVERAIRWLKNSQRCHLVLSESHSYYTFETPDAIGFKGNVSTLIECKTSINDFYKDRNKIFRKRPEMGMGVYRYYLTPKNLININKLSKKWGLLEVRGKVIRKIKGAEMFDSQKAAYMERPLLVSAAVYGKAE